MLVKNQEGGDLDLISDRSSFDVFTCPSQNTAICVTGTVSDGGSGTTSGRSLHNTLATVRIANFDSC